MKKLKSYALTFLHSYGLTVLFLFLTTALFAQTNFFYSTNGKKEYLKIKKDMALVRCTPETDIETWIEQFDFTSADILWNNLVIVRFDSLQLNLNHLQRNSNILDVAYALEYADGAIQIPTNHIFIKMSDRGSPEDLLNSFGFEQNIEKIELFDPYNDTYLVTLNIPLGDILLTCRNLYETGKCELVTPNFIGNIFLNSTSSCPPQGSNLLYPDQWGLNNTEYPGIDISAEKAWCITKGSPNIKIAIIDSGVQLDHPDLAENILLELGYDATSGTGNTYGGPYGNDDHGTNCAGIIAAVDNNMGVIGVAPQCKIVPIRISYRGKQRGDSVEDWTDEATLTKGIYYACDSAKVDIISCSWVGGGTWHRVTAALKHAIRNGRDGKGCVVVAGAGNHNTNVAWPANLDSVISVGSITSYGWHLSDSHGKDLDCVAPGVYIYTTTLNSTYGHYDGTSMACPHVSGIAALMLSVNPCLTPEEVRKIIALSCKKVPYYLFTYFPSHEYGTWNCEMGYGLVNAYKSVMYALTLSQIHNFNVSGTTIEDSDTIQLNINTCYAHWGHLCEDPYSEDGNYLVKRYKVETTVSYDYMLSPVIQGIANGLSADTNNNGEYYMGVVNYSETEATVKTYVYEVSDASPYWLPCHPDSVRFHISVTCESASLHHDHLYLQNEMVNTTESYNVINHVAAGKNVTPELPTGNYMIQNGGKVSIHAGESVLLADGFTASEGSYFRAYIEPFFSCDYTAPAPAKGVNNEIFSVIGDYSVEKTDEENVWNREAYLKLYPNPSAGEVTIEYFLNRSDLVEIALYDNFGKLVYKLKNRTPHDAGVYKITLNGVDLPNGIYFCTLKTENEQKTEKLMMVR
jgi:hypothetical protein